MKPQNVTSKTVIIIVAGVIGVIVLVSAFFGSFVIVPSGYVGVVTTFGKVTSEIQPGFQWKLPFVQSVVQMNVQIQKEQSDAGAATHDLQSVNSTVALNYHLDHAQVSNVYVNLSADYSDRIISPTVQEAVKVVTARYDASDLLAKRAQVADDITKLLIDKLQPRGIIVDQVSIVHFQFSDAFNQSIEQKQVAQQQAEQAQYDLQTANLKAQANQVQQAALTPDILEQQAIAKWDGKLPTYLGQGSVFNIPLNK